jgi:hypothetical protein
LDANRQATPVIALKNPGAGVTDQLAVRSAFSHVTAAEENDLLVYCIISERAADNKRRRLLWTQAQPPAVAW